MIRDYRTPFQVQQFLNALPYKAYRKRFPERKPLYYPNRRTWTSGYPKGR